MKILMTEKISMTEKEDEWMRKTKGVVSPTFFAKIALCLHLIKEEYCLSPG